MEQFPQVCRAGAPVGRFSVPLEPSLKQGNSKPNVVNPAIPNGSEIPKAKAPQTCTKDGDGY